jgi:hypothetical protein
MNDICNYYSCFYLVILILSFQMNDVMDKPLGIETIQHFNYITSLHIVFAHSPYQ